MFKGKTLSAVGGRLYPWQHGPYAESGYGGSVPMTGTRAKRRGAAWKHATVTRGVTTRARPVSVVHPC
jgi:hypothetical protein